jgi:ribosome-associated protein
MLEITGQVRIPEDEFEWSFVRSGGPGGQNVNKVASKAVLRWNVATSPSLPEDVKQRFRAQQHRRITAEGDLVVSSQRYRDQDRNRQDCLEKLRAWLLQATAVPRARKRTRPSRAAKERRLAAKRRKAATKAARRPPAGD